MACAVKPMEATKYAANGLIVHSLHIDGNACTRVEWWIRDPLRKLRISCGFPLVSPEFELDEGCLLRVSFTAGEMWASEYNKTRLKQKKSTAKTDELPLHGSLQLKALGNFALDNSARWASLSVGRLQQGMIELTERTVQGFELVADWRKELDADEHGDLRICIDFFRA